MSDTPVVDLNASSESDDGIALGHYAQRAYLEYCLLYTSDAADE